MGMTVQRRKDNSVPRVITHKIADIRGGVSVKTTELGNNFLLEGAVLSAPDKGICHIVKYAVVSAEVDESGKEIKVKKGHKFKIGDFVMKDVGGKAYAITAIDSTDKAFDTVTIGTAVGAIKAGEFIIEAAAQSTNNTSALKYTPLAIVGTGKPIEKGQNLDTDAWLFAVTKGNPLPDCISKHLKGIINY